MEERTFTPKEPSFLDHLFRHNQLMDPYVYASGQKWDNGEHVITDDDFSKISVSKFSNASKSGADIGMSTTCT